MNITTTVITFLVSIILATGWTYLAFVVPLRGKLAASEKTATDLRKHLAASGLVVTKRTSERDAASTAATTYRLQLQAEEEAHAATKKRLAAFGVKPRDKLGRFLDVTP